jgi:hypothetical protein
VIQNLIQQLGRLQKVSEASGSTKKTREVSGAPLTQGIDLQSFSNSIPEDLG